MNVNLIVSSILLFSVHAEVIIILVETFHCVIVRNMQNPERGDMFQFLIFC